VRQPSHYASISDRRDQPISWNLLHGWGNGSPPPALNDCRVGPRKTGPVPKLLTLNDSTWKVEIWLTDRYSSERTSGQTEKNRPGPKCANFRGDQSAIDRRSNFVGGLQNGYPSELIYVGSRLEKPAQPKFKVPTFDRINRESNYKYIYFWWLGGAADS
jgi:hypothetical protein